MDLTTPQEGKRVRHDAMSIPQLPAIKVVPVIEKKSLFGAVVILRYGVHDPCGVDAVLVGFGGRLDESVDADRLIP